MVNARQAHWDNVYATRKPDSVSWYQLSAELSLSLIRASGIARDEPIIDIGGGASVLVDQLLEAGFVDVSVLDIAESALDASKARLGSRAGQVQWIVADILSWIPARAYALWHDRAVFHFLTQETERARYRSVLARGLKSGARRSSPPSPKTARALQRLAGSALVTAGARIGVWAKISNSSNSAGRSI
jgi:hypothetical protein